MTKIDFIKTIIEKNNGILLTSDLQKHNIPRQYIVELTNQGYIEKVQRGVYVLTGMNANEFFCMQQKYKKGIFSHNTALYFYHLTDRTPFKLDMTFPNNIRLDNDLVSCHYILPENYELGLTTITLPDRTNLKIYDMERTICDIIKNRNKIDSQIVISALKEYAKRKDKNLILLFKYAKILKVDKVLREYMEVLI